MITIYNFARGGRGLRVAWQCEEMGLAYRCATVTYPPSEAYLALNPLGTVPFLEDDDGAAITESVAMMLYLAQRHGPTPLLPMDDPVRHARVLQFTVFGEASFGATLNPLMAAHFGAPAADKGNWSARMLGARAEQFAGVIEAALAEGPFLAGPDLTLADICVGTGLGIWRGALDKTLSPALAEYHDRLSARPAYQRASTASQG
jgi:glutathione S-transferase